MNVDPLGCLFWLIPVVVGVVAVSLLTVSGHNKPVKESEIVVNDININNKNPNGYINVYITESGVEIFDSYKFTNKVDRYKILEIIMQSKEYINYGYSRSIDSYQSEWQVHNIAYNLNFKRKNAKDVYLNKEFTGARGKFESFIYFLNFVLFN